VVSSLSRGSKINSSNLFYKKVVFSHFHSTASTIFVVAWTFQSCNEGDIGVKKSER